MTPVLLFIIASLGGCATINRPGQRYPIPICDSTKAIQSALGVYEKALITNNDQALTAITQLSAPGYTSWKKSFPIQNGQVANITHYIKSYTPGKQSNTPEQDICKPSEGDTIDIHTVRTIDIIPNATKTNVTNTTNATYSLIFDATSKSWLFTDGF